jgi:hypothetical protein
MPIAYSRQLILWLWVSFFFRLPSEFARFSSIAMDQSDGPISALGLPIPMPVLSKSLGDLVLSTSETDDPDAMNMNRVDAIRHILKTLYSHHDFFLQRNKHCTDDCNSIMLGALIREMHAKNLLYPKPVPPYLGVQHSTVRQVRLFRTPTLLEEHYETPNETGPVHRQHNCENSSFRVLFSHLDKTINGLDLAKYTA